jgi:hypothetical protein
LAFDLGFGLSISLEKAARELADYMLVWVGVQVRVDEDITVPAAFLCGNESENQFSTGMTSCFRHCVRFSHFWVVTKC